MTRKNKIPVGIIGATGPVGQKIAQMLKDHPWFELVWVAASKVRASTKYMDAVADRMFVSPESISHCFDLMLDEPNPNNKVSLVFSSLASDAAAEIEPQFAKAGIAVCSNAAAYRMDEHVPIVMADINPAHLRLVEVQRASMGWNAPLVTNSNCSTTGVITSLSPLSGFGIKCVSVVTFQALSGAGHPGPSAYAVLGNVIPYIENEELKISRETRKMMGTLADGAIAPATFTVDAACARVPVANGHLLSVNVAFSSSVCREDILAAWSGIQPAGLPSTSDVVVDYLSQPDRPQPRLDIARGNGMTVSTGRLRATESGGWTYFALVDNVVRGAAGAAISNGELLVKMGYIGK